MHILKLGFSVRDKTWIEVSTLSQKLKNVKCVLKLKNNVEKYRCLANVLHILSDFHIKHIVETC